MAKTKRFYKPVRIIVQKGTEPGKREAVISIILSVFALLFYPLFIGIIAFTFAIISYKKGQKGLGIFAIFMSIGFSIIGMILGIMAHYSMDQSQPIEAEEVIGGIIRLAI